MNLRPEILEVVNQAWQTARKYPASREGISQAIKDFGGQQTLRQGLKALDNPKVINTLSTFGVNTEDLKNMGSSFLEKSSSTDASDIKSRLARLQGK